LDLQEFDLNDAVQHVLHILAPEATKRGVVVIAKQVQAALPVRADRIHLQQVILNLALNGMDAMLSALPNMRKMAFYTTLVGKSEVEVAVSDSGTGIPQDKLNAVFETFYTTKSQGTGLGLSIARTIIETYGGKIWAENRIAGGAIFRFTLPLAAAHSARAK
jgi:signal transduction histidine kinase